MKLNSKDYQFPKDLAAYELAVKEFCKTELIPLTLEMEKTKKLSEKVLPTLAESGLLKATLPKEWGGLGLTFSQYWPILLEVAKTGGAIRLLVHSMNIRWRTIYAHGTEKQKKQFLPLWLEGKWTSGAITEPDAGTGLDIKTTAKKVGNVWRVNGTKHLITYADIAQVLWILCYTGDRSLGAKGISILYCKPNTPGLTIEPHKEAMGLWGSYHGILHFKDCEIPAENMLGKEGEGLDVMLRTSLDPSRMSIAVSCLGPAEKMIELSAEFAKQRVTFGKPIAEREGIRNMLADMAVDAHATRCIIANASAKYDRGEPIATEGAICKLFGLEMVGRVSDKAMLIHGGVGYTKAHEIERLYRDVRGMWFEEGTPSVHRLIISRDVLGKQVRSIGK